MTSPDGSYTMDVYPLGGDADAKTCMVIYSPASAAPDGFVATLMPEPPQQDAGNAADAATVTPIPRPTQAPTVSADKVWKKTTYNSDDTYEGWHTGSDRNGFGIYRWEESGDVFYGMYKDNGRIGFGVYLDREDYFHLAGGFWQSTQLNGMILYKDGRRVSGVFLDYVAVSGQSQSLQYDPDSCFVRDLRLPGGILYTGETEAKGWPDGYGVMQYTDGSLYVGQLRDGLREGYGIWVSTDHDVQEGYWLSDVYAGTPEADNDAVRRAKESAKATPVPVSVPTPTPAPTSVPTATPGRELPGSGKTPVPTATALQYMMVLELDGETIVLEQNYGSLETFAPSASYLYVVFRPDKDSFHEVTLSIPNVGPGTVLTSENVGDYPYMPYSLEMKLSGTGFHAETDIKDAGNGRAVNQMDHSDKNKRFRITIDSVSEGVYTGTIECFEELEHYSSSKPFHATGTFRFKIGN